MSMLKNFFGKNGDYHGFWDACLEKISEYSKLTDSGKLSFAEIFKYKIAPMCFEERLNTSNGNEELKNMFDEADIDGDNFLS